MSLPRDLLCFGAGLSAGALLYYLTARRKSNIDTRGLIYFDVSSSCQLTHARNWIDSFCS
jgi:hypothetical protein